MYRQCCWVVAWLVPRETAAVSAQVLCTLSVKPCCSLQCRFIQSHIGGVHVCLAVTCHLHFWQNDRDLLRAYCGNTGWNGYHHRKLTTRRTFPAARDLSIMSPALKPLSYPRSSEYIFCLGYTRILGHHQSRGLVFFFVVVFFQRETDSSCG